MPKVTFILRDGTEKTVEFEQGKLPYHEHGLPESFLDVAMNFGIPLEHACGGSCACTTCHLIIRQGEQNLSEMEDNEADRLDTARGIVERAAVSHRETIRALRDLSFNIEPVVLRDQGFAPKVSHRDIAR